jgi:hypothetical protein
VMNSNVLFHNPRVRSYLFDSINLAVEKAVGMPFGISNDKSQSQLFELCNLPFEIRRFATTGARPRTGAYIGST